MAFRAHRGGLLGLAAPLLALLLGACDEASVAKSGDAPAAAPPPVDVARPLVKSIVEWDEYTGQFEAAQSVEIRARVSGYLDEVHFREGQIVEKDQLLYVIDRRPFVAELARAQAQERRAKAQLDLADLKLKRGQTLVERRVISVDELDERKANRAVAFADLVAAQADVRLAELNLNFTEIRAPLTGRISDSEVDIGNLISGGSADSTLLTTVVSLDPIYFAFDASEADSLRYRRLKGKGLRPSSRENPNPVYVRLMDETTWARKGEMNFVDNRQDPNSGTIRVRAVFENPDLLLTPGLFGRLRLIGSNEYEAILLPDKAVLSDQSRKIVMTVDQEGLVSAKVVELGPVVDGLRVIRSGLSAEDRVVVRGVQRARPGQPVTAEPVTIGPNGELVSAE